MFWLLLPSPDSRFSVSWSLQHPPLGHPLPLPLFDKLLFHEQSLISSVLFPLGLRASPAWGLQYSFSRGSRTRGRWGGASRHYLGVEGAHVSAPVRGWDGGEGARGRPRTRLRFRRHQNCGQRGSTASRRHTGALSPARTVLPGKAARPPVCAEAKGRPPRRHRRRAGRPLYGDVRAAPRRVARETTFPALWFPGPPLPIHLFRQWGRRRFRTNPQHSRPQ